MQIIVFIQYIDVADSNQLIIKHKSLIKYIYRNYYNIVCVQSSVIDAYYKYSAHASTLLGEKNS